MYVGHFACGVALWAVRPRTPPWVPLVGIGVLDILNGVGVATGIERISPAPHEPLGLALDYIDWDHSLVMAIVWAIAFAVAVGWKHGRGAAAIGGLAVLSHFVGDVLMHNGDLAVWPGSEVHLGLWLWHIFPVGSWFIEGAFALGLIAFAIAVRKRDGVPVGAWTRALVILGVVHLSFAPGIGPLKFAGTHLDGAALAWTYAVLVIVGFLVPGWLLARVLPGGRPRI